MIFNSGDFTNVDLNNFLGVNPPSWVAASLDISLADAKGIDYDLPGFAPAMNPPSKTQNAGAAQQQKTQNKAAAPAIKPAPKAPNAGVAPQLKIQEKADMRSRNGRSN